MLEMSKCIAQVAYIYIEALHSFWTQGFHAQYDINVFEQVACTILARQRHFTISLSRSFRITHDEHANFIPGS